MMVVQSTHHTILYLPSLGPTPSSITQYYWVMVVQSTHTVPNLPSMEPITLSATQPMGNLVLVVQSLAHHVIITVCLASLERTTSSATQQFFCCGAIFADNILLTFTGTSNFSNNSAESGGAIVTFDYVVLTFNGTNNFIGNSANADGGAMYIDTNISLIFTGNSSFGSNSATQGGAISANHNSTLIFNGNIRFTNNGHKENGESQGGALYLSISATLNILPHTTVYWENNHANLGGAIYVYDVNPLIYCATITRYTAKEECFFQLSGQNLNHIKVAQYPGFLRSTNLESKLIDFFVLLKF